MAGTLAAFICSISLYLCHNFHSMLSLVIVLEANRAAYVRASQLVDAQNYTWIVDPPDLLVLAN